MLNYSILDLKNIEISYESGTKIDGVYDRITMIKNNVIKVINGNLDFRYNNINGYAVLREVSMYDEVTGEDYIDYDLYVGEIKITVHPSDVVKYHSENEYTTNFLKFTDDAMSTLYQNPDKIYKIVPVVTETGIVITVEEEQPEPVSTLCTTTFECLNESFDSSIDVTITPNDNIEGGLGDETHVIYEIPAGDYSYVVTAQGYQSYSGTFTISAQDIATGTKSITFTLTEGGN